MAYQRTPRIQRPKIQKYGMDWEANTDPIELELQAIQLGKDWPQGSLFEYYKNFAKVVWPDDWWSRWDDLILEEVLKGGYLGIAGPSSASKTHRVACTLLTTYWAFPRKTTGLVSTTTLDSLDMRIWGEIKKHFRLARERDVKKVLAGHFIESKQMITTDGREIEGREFRDGIKGIACRKGDRWEGLGPYLGLKNDHVILAADESQAMSPAFFDSCGNLSSNPRFDLVAMGNPKDPMDSFGQISEPEQGWDSVQQGVRTQVWKTKFRGGRCLNLVGTDSPNLEAPEGKEPYPKLIGRRYISDIAHNYGKDSWQYKCWVLAMFPASVMERRIITRNMCIKFHAMEEAVWQDKSLVNLFGMDAAYGSVGGDRCVGGHFCYGLEASGKTVLALVGRPMIIPVDFSKGGMPEDQIVEYVKDYCVEHGISPRNVFFDGTGRSSLTSAFARKWSTLVNPIEFGGMPSDRPYPANPELTCREAYSKFVTELWYSVRLAIENEQVRGLTEEIVHEFQLRAWDIVKGNKIEAEPKSKTKERLGRSPDLADMVVTGCEGARRLGFQIGQLGESRKNSPGKWLKELANRQQEVLKKKALVYA